MKSKDKKELHAKSVKELNNLVIQAKDAFTELRMQVGQNKLKNTSLLTNKRKEIAQMLTVIRMKELAETQAKKKE